MASHCISTFLVDHVCQDNYLRPSLFLRRIQCSILVERHLSFFANDKSVTVITPSCTIPCYSQSARLHVCLNSTTTALGNLGRKQTPRPTSSNMDPTTGSLSLEKPRTQRAMKELMQHTDYSYSRRRPPPCELRGYTIADSPRRRSVILSLVTPLRTRPG